MGVNLKCPCGCVIKFNDESACSCGMYKLNTVVIDGKNVTSVVEI